MTAEPRPHIEPVHLDGYDPSITMPYVPAIRVVSGSIVFIAGVTAAPVYHDHPHVPEVFDSIPTDAETQARRTFEHLDAVLKAAGCGRGDLVSLTRFFTNVAEDQNAINRIQSEWLGGHLPTSVSVEVTRLATDPRLRLEIQGVAVSRNTG
jgi:enamine deaminase RidA (YjgF/YER057c/UK114 family)